MPAIDWVCSLFCLATIGSFAFFGRFFFLLLLCVRFSGELEFVQSSENQAKYFLINLPSDSGKIEKKIKMHRMLVKMVVGMPEGRITIFISLLAARSGRCGGARPKGDERVVYYRTMCSIWWRIDVGNYIYATASITLGKERRVLARARAWHTTATVCARGCRRNFDAPNFFHALKWLWSIYSFVVVFSSTPNQITRVERSRIIFVPKNT